MKSVILSGAAGGVGVVLVRKLVQSGYVVYAGYIDDWELGRLNDIISELNTNRIIPVLLDLRVPEHTEQVVSKVEKNHPDFAGLLVNGAFAPMGIPFEHTDEDLIREVFEINVFGNLRLIRRCLELLKANKGRIVFTGSILGIVSGVMVLPYSTSKHASEGYMKFVRSELSRYGIKTVIINPALIYDTFMAAEQHEGAKRALAAIEGCRPEDISPHTFDTGQNTALMPIKVVSDPTYRSDYRGLLKSSLVGLQKKLSSSPELVANKIMLGLEAKNPKMRYLTGWDCKITLALKRILPESWFVTMLQNLTSK